ncbi:MAG TPA: DoxX-like family protein [Burkholderiaceae bacterium]|nr:DoxX-like family protein [Burkholderiaceae bacterium]
MIITLRLPKFWLHPYGLLMKTIPMLALLLALHVLERHDEDG